MKLQPEPPLFYHEAVRTSAVVLGEKDAASASRRRIGSSCARGAKAAGAAAQSKGGAAKKKKWSKGKVKDKANNAVVCDKPTFDRIMKEVPTFKMISQSVLIERMKINGSLARVAIQHLHKEGLIKPVIHHRAQLVYTRATAEADA
ncbi:hypothetical protein JCM3774_000817 [Rhodotorula dairenensis]